MTHDELLAKIDYSTPSELKAITLYAALRAVVELHKPQEQSYSNGVVYRTVCTVCLDSPLADNSDYPCPTIQQIIENLK